MKEREEIYKKRKKNEGERGRIEVHKGERERERWKGRRKEEKIRKISAKSPHFFLLQIFQGFHHTNNI